MRSCGMVYHAVYNPVNVFFFFSLRMMRLRYTLGTMRDSKPIPIRMSKEMIARLDRAALTLKLDTRAAVIKFCLHTFLSHIEKDGENYLPDGWRMILRETDGRTTAYRTKTGR